ncbi:hypothetical protein EV361DRAFT_798315, partial [Lentinula raphanica]
MQARADSPGVLDLEYITPSRMLHVSLPGGVKVDALLDDGAESSIMTEAVWLKTGTPLNREKKTRIGGVGGEVLETLGCVEQLEISVDGFRTWAHVFVVRAVPHCAIILGRPWQKAVKMEKIEDTIGVAITIHD